MRVPLLPKWLRALFRDEHQKSSVAFFRQVPLFYGLSGTQLERLLLSMQRRTYRVGEIVFEEGEIGKAVFILRTGQVELTRRSADGAARRLARLGPGQMFGEMALLEQMERTATARVVEDGDIYLLYVSTLDAFFERHPRTGIRMIKNIAILLSALLRRANLEMDEKFGKAK